MRFLRAKTDHILQSVNRRPIKMAYDSREVDKLKSYTKEIIDEHYLPTVHEMRKKLTVALSKEQELLDRLDRFEKQIEQYQQCHDCHRIAVEKRETSTQTSLQPESAKEPTSSVVNPTQNGNSQPRSQLLPQETKSIKKHIIYMPQRLNSEPETIMIDSD